MMVRLLRQLMRFSLMSRKHLTLSSIKPFLINSMALQPISNDYCEAVKPFLSTDDAAQLFSRLYDMPKATLVKPLDGYDSQNFLIKIEHSSDEIKRSSEDPHYGAKSDGNFVLKVMSAEESKDELGIRSIHSIQSHLKEHGFLCAAPLKNIHGDDIKLEEFTNKQPSGQTLRGQFIVRAYPYIQGSILNDVVPANSTQVFYEAGKLLADLHKTLETYPHDTKPLKDKAENFIWSLNQLSFILSQHIDLVKDDKRKCLVMDVVKTFESKVLTRKHQFKSGILHNDFSNQNLVVSPVPCSKTPSRGQHSITPGIKTSYKICGVIDFDDCQYDCYIFGIGVGMMYMTLSKAAGDQPLHASAAFLAGYQAIRPLTPSELEVLHVCQAARFVQSLLLGLYTYTLQPGNEYLLDTQSGWPTLECLWTMKPESIQKLWKDVANECAKFDRHDA